MTDLPKKNTPWRPPTSRKKELLKKSRYYQEQRKKKILIGGIACGIVVLLLLFLLVSALSKIRIKKSSDKEAVSMIASGEDSSANTENHSADAGHLSTDDSNDSSDENAPNTQQEPVSITVSVVGDCTLGTDENFDYSTSLNASYEYYGADYFFQNVKSIFSADDLTIANMEGTLTDSTERADKLYAFKAPASCASILSSGSVEAVNMANNHSHDYGDQSFSDTLSALDAEGIVHFGYDETAVMEIKGVKVGLVGIYELNDHLERTQQLKDNIAKVKAEGAQLTIVIFHWGNEKETVPDSNQMTLGRLAIDEGADLVCGHHPHVLQGIESYKGKSIVYSLGNFCFGGNSYPSDMDTMIFQQTFTVDADGVQDNNDINIIPCSISSDYGYNNYQPTPSEGEEASRILAKIEERSSWIEPAVIAAPPG